jgi:predicted transcriptional regulator
MGVVTVAQVKNSPRDRWPLVTLGQAMIPVSGLLSARPGDALAFVLARMDSENANQISVMEEGRLVGVVTRDHIFSFIRTLSELRA